jgi:hypothetical protein
MQCLEEKIGLKEKVDLVLLLNILLLQLQILRTEKIKLFVEMLMEQ